LASKEEKILFSQMIETRSLREGVQRMEAILDHCEETGLEPEIAATLLTTDLKLRIEEEAGKLHFLKEK